MRYTENRGSEWHKWDLHVHTPASGLNNNFLPKNESTWDEYVKVLFNSAIEKNVKVIGITDYFVIDGYKKLKSEYLSDKQRLLALFEDEAKVDQILKIKIFPNIEFRLSTLVDSNRINFHVIFSDELSVEDIEELFLTQLQLKAELDTSGRGTTYACNKRGLEQIGSLIKSQQSTFKGDTYEIGCTVAVVDVDKIVSVLSDNAIFSDKYVFATPVDEDLCRINWNSQGHLVRKHFYQLSHIFFTSNPNTHSFALGQFHESPSKYLDEFKTFKPCFIGSDAHSFESIREKLGQWNTESNEQSRITWVKADPTFTGLLQTIYEPETRVHIQSSCPDPKTDMQVISSIRFDCQDNTFNSSKKILLNENLNSIIGGKSSGKSLLLSSVAKAINKEMYNDINKVLHIDGYGFVRDVFVEWRDGKVDSFENKEPSHSITYIPQLYINYLAEKNNHAELNEFLLDILLQNGQFRNEYEYFLTQSHNIEDSINDSLQVVFGSLNEYKVLKKKLSETGTPDTISKSIITLEAKIKEITDRSSLNEKEKIEYATLFVSIDNCHRDYTSLKSSVDFATLLDEMLRKTTMSLFGEMATGGSFSWSEIDNLSARFNNLPSALKPVISEIRNVYWDAYKHSRRIVDELQLSEKLARKEDEEKRLVLLLEPYEKRMEKQKDLSKLQEQLASLKTNLTRSEELVARIERVNEDYKRGKDKIIYCLRERISLYDNFARRINAEFSRIEDITLEASIRVNSESLTLYNIVNKHRTTNSFFDSIFVNEDFVEYEKIPDFLENMTIFKDGEIQFADGSRCIVNKDVTITHIFNAIVENEMKLVFDIKYKNDSLHQMSPGKKGTVLLILFLQISSSEYPILIDQPEDNLDNRTIYELLCTMIKKKKSERQIIIVTHNANLVVGTDSENIIVANQAGQNGNMPTSSYRFEYVNGPIELSFKDSTEINALEKQGIKEHVCEVLEGGLEAFVKREQKYSI